MAKPAPRPGLANIAAVAVGGVLGALVRFLPCWPTLLGAEHLVDPLPTLIVNLLGAVLLGFIAGHTKRSPWPEPVHQGITVGLLGAFTTMSSLTLTVSALVLGGPTLPTASTEPSLSIMVLTVFLLVMLLMLTTFLTVVSYRLGLPRARKRR